VNGDASYSELFNACRVLFGHEVDLSVDFLQYLHHDGVKAAFRRKAKETHPDLAAHLSPHNAASGAELFHRANEAYELLGKFIRNRGLRPKTDNNFVNASRQCEKSPGSARNTYHHGSLPPRPLPLGRYLYYRGIIPFRALLDALTWQRGGRATIGSIARELGWLSHSDVEAILSARPVGRFGENAVRCGLLNSFQVKLLLMNQKSRMRRIGQYFVAHNMVSRQQMELLARDHLMHNRAFGKQY
jgi:hypothetical protein